MNQQQFVHLALAALGLVVLSFVLLGFSRLVVGYRTAQVIAAPVGILGFTLVCFLFIRATLSATGLWPIADSGDGESLE